MTNHHFDDLIESLICATQDAKEKCQQHQEGRIRKIYTDDSGQALTWTFSIPVGPDGHGGYSELELPLLSLRTNQSMHISEFSMDFDCEVDTATERQQHYVQNRDRERIFSQADTEDADFSLTSPLILTLTKWRHKLFQKITDIKISLYGEDLDKGIAKAEGKIFKRFELDGRQQENNTDS